MAITNEDLITAVPQEKAVITKIGTVGSDDWPYGWEFDLQGRVPALSFSMSKPTLFGGYTIDELRIIQLASSKQPIKA